MIRNMGSTDKSMRFIIAAIVVLLYVTNVISGVFGLVLMLFAGIFVLTSLVSFCPLYTLFGFSTCSVKDNRIQ